jgi:hypothetical protein
MPEYKYFDVVKHGVNAARVRDPRLQDGVANEFAGMLSAEVARDEWTQIDGTAVNVKGMSVEQYLDHLVSTRPFWLVPATVVDAADTTWTSGSLAEQGKRWRELRDYLGSDKAADKALREEAAIYNTVPGSTKPGIRPGYAEKKKAGQAFGREDGPPLSSNPWSDTYRGTPQEALAEQTRIIKTGSERARTMAKACGVSVFNVPLRK